MEKILPLEEQSINQVYIESHEKKTYLIPIYQRNYAWEEDEITALIKDVYDSMKKDSKSPYYIGTLVTYKRGDNVYEVIDGQQRLTTIYIILKALGVKDIKNKLTYGARKKSASTIQKLDFFPELGDDVDEGIRNGYKFAEKAIIAVMEDTTPEEFKKYFLHNVHIIHYDVPKDVDLNHYFEVMNSRGEQLEMHEIVKSTLGQYLKDKTELATFSRVWEACSEMNIYIQQTIDDLTVFGNKLENMAIECFEQIPVQAESDGKDTIKALLEKPICKQEEVTNTDKKDKFQPIIDFPNFLLIVLKVTRMEYENFDPTKFILDDKELLKDFDKTLENIGAKQNKKFGAEFARRFVFNLLKARYYLDNYIVHHSLDNKEHSGDNPWELQYFHLEKKNNKKNGYPSNLADGVIQDELVHLLSMFEVTFTQKQRKNYLFYCLLYLFNNPEPKQEDYLEFLQGLADKYFYDVYLNKGCLNDRNQPGPNAFDNALLVDGELVVDKNNDYKDEADYRTIFEDIFEQGCSDIPLFVFNYTDYILWKKYADSLRGSKTNKDTRKRKRFFEDLGCSDFGLELFDNFYFSRTRKTLEHYYPQAKAGEGKPLSLEDINCFGNFAMIGAETNSRGSSYDPKQKLDLYSDGKSDQVSVSSLKFKVMMQMCLDNHKALLNKEMERGFGMEWNAEDMQTHQSKMLDIIFNE